VVYIGIIVFLAIVYSVFTTIKDNGIEAHFFPALGLKLAAGITLGFLYFQYYGSGDTLQYDGAAHLIMESVKTIQGWFLFLFHSDLNFLSGPIPQVLQEPRSLFFIKILSLLYLLTGGSYWLASLYLSFFSFYGAWLLSEAIVHYWPELKYPAIVSFLYFLPVVFWSSGVLKDAVAYGCITALGTLIISGINKGTIGRKAFLTGLLMIWVLWSVKYHLAVILMLSIGMGIVFQPINEKYKGIPRYILLALFFITAAIAFSYLHPNFRLGSLLEVLRQNHEKIIKISEGVNLVHFMPYGTGLVHFLLNLPIALFAGLFMPLPGQGNGLLPNLAGFFNALILLLTILKIISLKGEPVRLNAWYLMLGIYIVLLAVMLAYATPNFGTLERYKTAYIPFYIFWLLDNKLLFHISKSLFFHKFWGTY
jgi:hypothetical protein